jgi:putative hemolysin
MRYRITSRRSVPDISQRLSSFCVGSIVMRNASADVTALAAFPTGSGVRRREIDLTQGAYRVRLATSAEDRLAAFRLRFLVFNLELKEGLENASCTGRDEDEFDAVCDHLIVEHANTGVIVGTYRMQNGVTAKHNLGYYSEREFEFAPYEPIRATLIELGRACIHRDHRSTDVLYLLWRGIAEYAMRQGTCYLIGCSSLTSQDPGDGAAVYQALQNHLAEPAFRTRPQAAFALPLTLTPSTNGAVPKLLRTYLAIGARICGPPAIDREFRTIDFLTLLDLKALHPRIRARFLPSNEHKSLER